ncbi:MAG: peptidase [Methanophagales archaeon]|nr:peptidase [Methanophagales archaeon]
MKKLWLCYDKESAAPVLSVTEALNHVFGLETDEELHLDAAGVKGAYNAKRLQYNASTLLNYLINVMSRVGTNEDVVSLWILRDDLYVEGMNFVFGVAHPGKAAVLSTHRLDSLDLINKEAIHEIGHVLGLPHCTNECVMQFSNSVDEAKAKPATLCDRCRSLLTLD